MKIIHCDHCGTRRVILNDSPYCICNKCRDQLKNLIFIRSACNVLELYVDSYCKEKGFKDICKCTLEGIRKSLEHVFGDIEKNTSKDGHFLYLKTDINIDGYFSIMDNLYYGERK